jgi:pimeloyl-ACP methyl ester carboxylesterase
MMQGAQLCFQRQATAFRTVGNGYAPYYRQIDATYQLSQPFAQQKKNIAGIPSTDVFAAFKHFLKHYDRGRPFILVGHSQGSAVLANLLARYMKSHPKIYARMIAAYVVGYPVQGTYLEHHQYLKFAKGPNDTGVIVSWNTEAPTVDGSNPVVQPGAIAINPITWTRSQTKASAEKNVGSIELNPATGGTPFLNADGTIKRFKDLADARVDKAKGVVVCSTISAAAPPYYTPGGFPMGVLHTFDYPLYFFSVRANAANRVQHFFAER